MLDKVLSNFGINPQASIQPFGSGLINTTWQVKDQANEYILQRINHNVFKNPSDIAENIETIASHLKKNHPEYFFVSPMKTKNNESLLFLPGHGYFRLMPFVNGSLTYNVTQTPEQAYEGAIQFGAFTRSLIELPIKKLKITLPDFHNLIIRYNHFNHACLRGNTARIKEAENEILFLQAHGNIVSTYKNILTSNNFKLRVTHHDTKISNVLFNSEQKGICVIDLDTVMPGFFISDVGDMMRTYLSPVSEEEKDFSKITLREEYFEAILHGYLKEMKDELTEDEVSHFVYAGLFLTYMQAIRFLTDHLNNDVYYGALYEGQNFARAKNQIFLFEQILNKEKVLNKMVYAATQKDASRRLV